MIRMINGNFEFIMREISQLNRFLFTLS